MFYNQKNVSSLKDFIGVNVTTKREIPIVVSLTSCEENFGELPSTINSIMNQELKPDRIVLWLDEDSYDLMNLPYEITRFIKNGLEIRFIKDLGTYNNLYYALKEFEDSIVVVASDSVYYVASWLSSLYLSYIAAPDEIQLYSAKKVSADNSSIHPSSSWERALLGTSSFYNFPIIDAGILFPPKCFSNEFFRKDVFLKLAADREDVWVWCLAVVSSRKLSVVKNSVRFLIPINIFKYFVKKIFGSKKRYEDIDLSIKSMLEYYRQNIFNKLN